MNRVPKPSPANPSALPLSPPGWGRGPGPTSASEPGIRSHRFARSHPPARLTAIINPALADGAGRPYGQLGFLDLADDADGARLLIAEALRWLSRQDANIATVLAPMNGDAWHDYRLMVAGFEEPPFPGEPRNPPWLPGLLEACGFAPFSEHVTKTIAEPAAALAAWARFHRRALARGVSFQAVDPADLDAVLDRAHRLSLAVFSGLPLFSPLPEDAFRARYAGVDGLLEPDGLLFALAPDGRDLGLCFAFRLPGHPRDLYLKSFGVRPEWQGTGLAAAFTAEVYRRWLGRGVTRVHHCLMGGKEASARFDRGAGVVTRRYQLFARPLDRAGS